MTPTRRALTTGLTATALAVSLTACSGADGDSGKSSSSTTPSSTSSSTALSTQAAYQQADKNYRAYSRIFNTACSKKATAVPNEMKKAATDDEITRVNEFLNTAFGGSKGAKINRAVCKSTVISTKGLEVRHQDAVSPWRLSLGLCLKSDFHLYDKNNHDLAVPTPGYKNGIVILRSPDKGQTWLVDDTTNINNPEMDKSCRY